MNMINSDIRFGIKSLLKRPIQTALLFASITILSFVLFGGIVICNSLQKGMDNMERRLGADLMIVPADSNDIAEDILLEGSRQYSYFGRDVYDDILSVEGVKEATPQMFLKSLTADCCSSEVQIVLFDPYSDFLITPWIKEYFSNQLEAGMAVIGSSVNIEDNKKIRLFGTEYEVAARMARTGTCMDQSVYFVFDTLPALLSDAQNKGAYILEEQKNADIISTVFINIEDGYKESKVVKKINNTVKENIGIVYPKQLAASISANLNGIYSIIKFVIIAFIVLLLFVMFIVYLISANDRKREISLFRILGASKINMVLLLIREAVIISIAGGLAGCILSTIFVIPFGNYIGIKLGMSYLGPDFYTVIILYITVIVIVIFTGVFSSIYPALHVSFMEPYTALRKEGE